MELKTYEEWLASELYFMDYCSPGDMVGEAIVDYFANCVPPVTFERGFVQAGEAYSHEEDETGRWRATYATFTITSEKDGAGRPIWCYRGHCFKGQDINRVNKESRFEESVSSAQREVEV